MVVSISFSIELAAEELPSLHEIYGDYFLVGGAVSVASWAQSTIDPPYKSIVEKQFNSLTAGNAMKPDYLQPRADNFNFSSADKMIDFAMDNNMEVRGHTLVWHPQTPDWFFRDEEGKLLVELDEDGMVVDGTMI